MALAFSGYSIPIQVSRPCSFRNSRLLLYISMALSESNFLALQKLSNVQSLTHGFLGTRLSTCHFLSLSKHSYYYSFKSPKWPLVYTTCFYFTVVSAAGPIFIIFYNLLKVMYMIYRIDFGEFNRVILIVPI